LHRASIEKQILQATIAAEAAATAAAEVLVSSLAKRDALHDTAISDLRRELTSCHDKMYLALKHSGEAKIEVLQDQLEKLQEQLALAQNTGAGRTTALMAELAAAQISEKELRDALAAMVEEKRLMDEKSQHTALQLAAALNRADELEKSFTAEKVSLSEEKAATIAKLNEAWAEADALRASLAAMVRCSPQHIFWSI
jgi:hypothetical protein